MWEEEDFSSNVVVAVVALNLLLATAAIHTKGVGPSRNASIPQQRLVWDIYCKRHVAAGTFKRRLRMEKESFDILLGFVYQWLLVNEQMADLRGGSIIPELCLYCTLRWLAGGSYLDITDIAGISRSSFYRVIWKTIVAIVICEELAIKWPTTEEEIQQAIRGFASISTEEAICNCVGVMDGFLVRIKVPSRKEAGNVRVFFSGHYQCYGINCQAVTDHFSRFIYFAVAAPGVSKDRDAVKQCGLSDMIEGLPRGICVIADAAYEPSEHLVPVYQGIDKLNEKYDNFNFYASQVRIRSEMAFGMMTKKWGVLQRPVGVALKNVKWMMQGIARLHNFCINERLRLQGTLEEEMSGAIREGRGFIPTVPHDENGDPIELDPLFNNDNVQTFRGYSELRECMAVRVENKMLTRPVANKIKRNNDGGDNGDAAT